MESENYFVRYKYVCGPGNEQWQGAALEVNCQAWVHRVLTTQYGIHLPSWLLSKEVFEDKTFTQKIYPNEPIGAGDIFLFGPNNLTDMRRLHWAIFTGVYAKETNDPILQHANTRDKTVSLWMLSEFRGEPRYEKLFAIKRPTTVCML
jgi:hypothetical protein